jgi:DNA-binding transcriptional ArsR family regulator
MSSAPADRILEALAEPLSLEIVRALSVAEKTQSELVRALELRQSGASRAIKVLRSVGMVESDSPRGPIRLRAEPEVKQILLAADRLAEAVISVDLAQQTKLSGETRRSAIHASDSGGEIDRRTTGPLG